MHSYCLLLACFNCLLLSATASNLRHLQRDENHSSIASLKSQPATYSSACKVLPHFSIPIHNGNISVVCATNLSTLHRALLEFNQTHHLLQHQYDFIMNKSIAYLERDSVLSLCHLRCSVGLPYPRFANNSLSPEPSAINVGCDELFNLRCSAAICSSRALQVENGEVTCSDATASGSMCSLHCQSGFVSKGPLQKLCNGVNHAWSPDNPFQCVGVTNLAGPISATCHVVGSTTFIFSTCARSLNVAAAKPLTTGAACPLASLVVAQGDVRCSDTIFDGSTCELQCEHGYRATGSKRKTCRQHAWQPEAPLRCERVPKCVRLFPVLNGRIECTDGNYAFSRCWLMCDRGFSPNSNSQKVCLPMGNVTIWASFSRDFQRLSYGIQMSCIRTNESNIIYKRTEKKLNGNDAFIVGTNTNSSNAIICAIRPEYRTPCGNRKVTKQLCEEHNCCWDNSTTFSFPCYISPNTTFNGVARTTTSLPHQPLSIDQRNLSNQNWISSNPSIAKLLLELRSLRSPFNQRPISSFERNILFGRPSLRNHPCNQCNRPSQSLPTGPNCGSSTNLSPPQVVNLRTLNFSINATEHRFNSARVLRGESASPENWPWHAIVYFNRILCGGTLIREDLVLTAAHCVSNADGSVDQHGTVALGVQDITIFKRNQPKLDERVQKFRSQRVIRHENFTVTATGITTNDIAIIKLNGRANVRGRYVKTLCLSATEIQPTDDCYVTGFGVRSRSGVASTTLQQACLPIVSLPACQRHYQNQINPRQHVCAGWTRPNSPDTCRGDSGGPLVCRTGSRALQRPRTCGWYLAGVTSFGKSPCASGSPSVFVDVFQYRDWIQRSIQSLEDWSSVIPRVHT